VDLLRIQARVMLELGLTPFSPEIKRFTLTHWYIFYSIIKEKDNQLILELARLLGVDIGDKRFMPFGYIVNVEAMKEVEKLKEIERLKEEKPEYKELSPEEMRFILEEIDKEVKKAEDKNQRTEW
jgi:hypothetical protein